MKKKNNNKNQYINKKNKSYRICLKALKENKDSFKYIPDEKSKNIKNKKENDSVFMQEMQF